MQDSAQTFLFDDEEFRANVQAQVEADAEAEAYAAARRAAWYAGTPFPEDEAKHFACTNGYPRQKENDWLNNDYREWYWRHSEWKKHGVQKRRALDLGRKVGKREPILRVYAKAKTSEPLACHWCKALTGPEDRHVDHIQPLSRGGNHTAKNLCICCASCNSRKHDRTTAEFLAVIGPVRRQNLRALRKNDQDQLALNFTAETPVKRKPVRTSTQLSFARSA